MIYEIELSNGNKLKVIAGTEEEAKAKLIESRDKLGLPTKIISVQESN